MFDYANGVDDYGNPLPEQLTDFLQDAYHDPRMSEKELDDLLQNIRPDMDIPEMNRDGTPAGLKRPLYPHQELAIAWMKKMETGSNKGGILADDMGLGKTISTLALILARPATGRPKVIPTGLSLFQTNTLIDKLDRCPSCAHKAVEGRDPDQNQAFPSTVRLDSPRQKVNNGRVAQL